MNVRSRWSCLWHAASLLLTLGCCCTAWAAIEEGTIQAFENRWSVTRWTGEDGLPENRVQALLQTGDGYIWVGTTGGLARFDGVRFKVLTASDIPVARSEIVMALAEDSEGGLWVGTRSGLLLRQDGAWRLITRQDGLWDDEVCALCPSANGGMWIGTGKGLNRWQGGKLLRLHPGTGYPSHYQEEPPPGRIKSIAEDATGRVWLIQNSTIELFDPASDRSKFVERNTVHRLSLDRAGTLWWGDDGGVHSHAAGKTSDYATDHGLTNIFNSLVLTDGMGNLWVRTRGGVFIGRDGVFTRARGAALFDSLKFECGLQDREGNFWLGSSRGLIRCSPQIVQVLDHELGLPGGQVFSIIPGPNESVWISTAEGLGIMEVEGHSLRSFPAARHGPFDFACADSILFDRNGILWGGTRLHLVGLSIFRDGAFVRQFPSATSSLNMFRIGTIYEDKTGRMWCGCSLGVWKREGETFEQFLLPGKTSMPDATGILEDRTGNFWFATLVEGIYRQNLDGTVQRFTTTNGLASNRVYNLHEDADGVIWAGTADGLSRIMRDDIRSFRIPDGLLDNSIRLLIGDNFGRLWMGDSRGLFGVSRSELDAVARGKLKRAAPIRIGEQDGLPSSVLTGSRQPGPYKDRGGKLWIPTDHGVGIVDASRIGQSTTAPLVHIEQVRIGKRVVIEDGRMVARTDTHSGATANQGKIRFAPGTASALEFDYTAASFVRPDRCTFQFKLDGYDRDWVDAGTRRVAFYNDLKPRDYVFRVRAFNSQLVPSQRDAEFSFRIAPHFYETTPFYASTGALALAGAFLVHVRRVRRLAHMHRLEHEHRLELERSRIARDIHDDLGSRLSQLAVLGELAERSLDPENKSAGHLGKIRKTTSEIFQALDETVWAVNPGQDSLAGLVSYLREQVGAILVPAEIRVRLDFPNRLPDRVLSANARHQIYLAVKEALHNIVKHAKASEVHLNLREERGGMSLTIADNGQGFLPDPNGNGNGLKNMRSRMEEIGGRVELLHEPGEGTVIRLHWRNCPTSSGGI